MLRLCQIWSILLGFTIAGMSVGALADDGFAAAPSFAEFCRGDIGADKVATFNTELDQANRAIAAGNQEMAEAALRDAAQAVWRGGAYDDSSVRCLGEPATRRWFNTQLGIWRQGWGSAPDGRANGYDKMYVVAADRGADGVVEVISYRPAGRFAASYRAVENISEVAEARQHYGTFQLPEEIAIAQACDDAQKLLQDYAKREHAKTLEAEDAAFNRPATQMEQDAIRKLGSIGGLAQAMAGVEIDTADQQEALVVRRQVDESNALLDVARGFEIEPVFGDSNQRPPSFLRAEQRGDTMLVRANDAELSLEVRDDFYTLARRYLARCQCRDKAVVAANAQESIQPALLAKAERDQEKMEKMQAEMQLKTEAMQQSVNDMKKTEAEKKSFEDEADALEDELDF